MHSRRLCYISCIFGTFQPCSRNSPLTFSLVSRIFFCGSPYFYVYLPCSKWQAAAFCSTSKVIRIVVYPHSLRARHLLKASFNYPETQRLRQLKERKSIQLNDIIRNRTECGSKKTKQSSRALIYCSCNVINESVSQASSTTTKSTHKKSTLARECSTYTHNVLSASLTLYII